MRATRSNYWIIAITLFALVGQGLLTNDSLMIPMAHANMAQQTVPSDRHASDDLANDNLAQQALSAQTDAATNTTAALPHKTMKNCHENVANMVNDVDEPISASLPQTSCCNGAGFCSLDCHHCLTISLIANLIDMQLPMSKIPIHSTPITMVVNRVSIAFPPAFRPPIA
jgi:hypothetical protein